MTSRKNRKGIYQKRRILIVRTCRHNCYQIRQDPYFVELFISFIFEMRKIAKKKGFNKKEFSGAFRIFNDHLGAYPFPQKLRTRYVKKSVTDM